MKQAHNMAYPELKTYSPLLKCEEAQTTFDHFEEQVPDREPKAALKIFSTKYTSEPYLVDLDLFIQTHAQCFGITDSGKTNSGAVVAEKLLDNGIKICVFDSVKQDFISLRDEYKNVRVLKFDGDPDKTASEFFYGKDSFVFDVLGTDKAVYVPFALKFLRALFGITRLHKGEVEKDEREARRDKRPQRVFNQPIKIFIDEANTYLPNDLSTIVNNELKQATKQLIEVVEEMHREARAYGLTFFLMCQRPTDMITSIRAQTGMYFLHRQLSFVEKDYYLKIIPSGSLKDREAIKQHVHSFPAGDCYFVIEKEARRLHVLRRKTRHGSRPIGLKDARGWSG